MRKKVICESLSIFHKDILGLINLYFENSLHFLVERINLAKERGEMNPWSDGYFDFNWTVPYTPGNVKEREKLWGTDRNPMGFSLTIVSLDEINLKGMTAWVPPIAWCNNSVKLHPLLKMAFAFRMESPQHYGTHWVNYDFNKTKSYDYEYVSRKKYKNKSDDDKEDPFNSDDEDNNEYNEDNDDDDEDNDDEDNDDEDNDDEDNDDEDNDDEDNDDDEDSFDLDDDVKEFMEMNDLN